MTVRERLERLENENLAPWATRSTEYSGREAEISSDDLRTNFQRDRDRILHSKSFRRLKHKTQCFLAPEGDHFRTRLTHTLEVSQISRTLARSLRLNEDLAEAIALGHDLGHTPFGHMGERILNRLMPTGFAHRDQSLRVIAVLENDGVGLNLTEAVRDGVAHHSGIVAPITPEGQCVVIADRIAYVNHDVDDAVRAGIITAADIPKELTRVLGDTHGARIQTMVTDIIRESEAAQSVRMSKEIGGAMDRLRKYLNINVYMREDVLLTETKADRLLSTLFHFLLDHPEEIPLSLRKTSGDYVERAVCDFLAGMTDQYAIHYFKELFVPTAIPYR